MPEKEEQEEGFIERVGEVLHIDEILNTGKKTAIALGLTFVAGAAYGVVVESHTNEVARGKAITAQSCLDVVPHESTINEALEDCLEDGIPGGQKIGGNHFDVGDPVGYVDAYISTQEAEATSIEAGRVVAWSAAPILVAGGVVYWFG